ncbi:hypothetical protein A2333_01495 [Candidatus Wolfebacteria bacterium RIFOXYB2_FULL_49_7]|nr:MAG: hypothetical protein A2333_01495 [Candidatus Wolfebacteria bacterium RIFOXYB2_FULL_49_7]
MHLSVIPAEAGIQSAHVKYWIPAFAGMTTSPVLSSRATTRDPVAQYTGDEIPAFAGMTIQPVGCCTYLLNLVYKILTNLGK